MEAVVKPGMTTAEKVASLESLLKMRGLAGNKLTKGDPFIFPSRFDSDYLNVFKDIVINFGVKEVEIITYRSKTTNFTRALMAAAIRPIPMTVYDADTYQDQDRYWIIKATEKMVHVGTLLNGLGKKLCLLTVQTKADTRIVINKISSITTF